MNILEAILLGGIQGITEFIPVSSSGHLELFGRIFSERGPNFHLFIELVNFGTLMALLWFFREKLLSIWGDVVRKKNWKLAKNLLITSIPAGVIGFLLSKLIRNNPFFSLVGVIGLGLGIVGVLMIFIEKIPKARIIKNYQQLSWKEALIIGLAQVAALIPGTSRSGVTIIAGRIIGLNNKSAAEYSFLASIPLMVGVCLKSLVSDWSYIITDKKALILSNLTAFVIGMLALKFLFKYLKRPDSLKYFGYYRLVLATIILVVVLVK